MTKTTLSKDKKNRPIREGKTSPLPGTKNGVQDNPWLAAESKVWSILLGLSILTSILLYPNILTRPKIYHVGDIADRNIKASCEFLIENKKLTEEGRNAAVRAVLAVYDFDSTGTNAVSRIKEAFSTLRNQQNVIHGDKNIHISSEALTKDMDSLKDRFFAILDIPPDDKMFASLMKNGFSKKIEEAASDLVSRVFNIGIVNDKTTLVNQDGKGITLHDINSGEETKVDDLARFYDIKAAKYFIKKERKSLNSSLGSQELSAITLKLADALIKPNLTFNKRETELRKDIARRSVKPFYFKVKKGEMLVREGQRITDEHILKLREQYKFIQENRMFGRSPAMMVLIGFLMSVMYLAGLMNRLTTNTKEKDLLFNALTILVIFLVVIAFNFVSEETARGFQSFTPRALLFAVPVASGAMIISVFQGMRVAVGFCLIISVLSSFAVGGEVEFFVYFFIGSMVAALGVKNCRERSVFIKTGVKVGVCNVLLALAIETLHGSFYTYEAVIGSVAAFIGGFYVGVITTGVQPLIEIAFGYTTDIKLLELANLEQPLLQDLMVQAPGTYHHSVIVSNMVEATAQAVNANPLLAKVAAYYHDIGKIKKPLYFIENQTGGENKHERLAPSMSALILISHVKDGVEMAKRHKLGREIIDIIRQHHGMSLITFFYEKAREQAEKKGGKSVLIKEEDFRYPGPKPQTKEAGLVMLADEVEAASRALVDPTAARIQGMVQKIINKVFSDGQLDECELTLKDLHQIAKGFNKTLGGIFHHRIEYPDSAATHTPVKRMENGDSNHLGAGTAGHKKTDDKAKNENGLKRLGLS